MTEDFFEQPILNSPYAYPAQHWELDELRQPTGRVARQSSAVASKGRVNWNGFLINVLGVTQISLQPGSFFAGFGE